ncbi:hypothetical protein C8R44DRAFT_981407 [Mycena epipterygia]|nr:hypothetical protein C8R44DRAFT_981407 [Mycena epipterygia]
MKVAPAVLLIFPAFVTAFPAVTSIMASEKHNAPSSSTVLFPKRHPDDDPANLANLKATTSATLYYEAPAAHALVHIPVFNQPMVSLERSRFLSSVSCNAAGNMMVITFKDEKSWEVASTDWAQYSNGFLIISHVHGCGEGVDKGERNFHLVSSVRPVPSKKQIICTMTSVEIEQAVHPDHVMAFQISKYDSAPATASLGRRGKGRKRPPAKPAKNAVSEYFENLFDKAGKFAVGVAVRFKNGETPTDAVFNELNEQSSAGNYVFDGGFRWGKTPFGPGYYPGS